MHPVTPVHATTICLGPLSPVASSDPPDGSGEQPSNAACPILLRVGFAEQPQSPAALVVSYTAVSPLPATGSLRLRAVCFLLHCPAGRPGWPLATTLL